MKTESQSSAGVSPAVSSLRPLEGVLLKSGSHTTPEDGMCIMEATAWHAGEKHSEYPQCACVIVREVLIVLNDTMTDEERQQLIRLIPLLVGSRAGFVVSLKRVFVIVDTLVRKTLPAVWDLLGLKAEALRLRELEAICDETTARRSRDVVSSIFENTPLLRALSALSDLRALSALRALSDLRALSALSDLRALRALSDLRALSALRALRALSDLRALRALSDLRALSALRALSDLRALRALSDLRALRALSDLRALRALSALSALSDLRALFIANAIEAVERALAIKE